MGKMGATMMAYKKGGWAKSEVRILRKQSLSWDLNEEWDLARLTRKGAELSSFCSTGLFGAKTGLVNVAGAERREVENAGGGWDQTGFSGSLSFSRPEREDFLEGILVVLRDSGTSKAVYISRKALGSMLENGGGWSGLYSDSFLFQRNVVNRLFE